MLRNLPKTLTLATMAVALSATLATAHDGVKDPIVKNRMEGMKEIGSNMGVLGDMAKGKRAFDANDLRNALESIAEQAALTPSNFEDMAVDPKSEAKLLIWDEFEDFSRKALDTRDAAQGMLKTVTDLDTLRASMGDIGGTCKACHSKYRE